MILRSATVYLPCVLVRPVLHRLDWHSAVNAGPHWAEVTLAAPVAVETVRLWNRADDGTAHARIEGAVVLGRDATGALHPCGSALSSEGAGRPIVRRCGPETPPFVAIRVELSRGHSLAIVELDAYRRYDPDPVAPPQTGSLQSSPMIRPPPSPSRPGTSHAGAAAVGEGAGRHQAAELQCAGLVHQFGVPRSASTYQWYALCSILRLCALRAGRADVQCQGPSLPVRSVAVGHARLRMPMSPSRAALRSFPSRRGRCWLLTPRACLGVALEAVSSRRRIGL